MGDEQRCQAPLALNPHQQPAQFVAAIRVDRRERLVEQQDARLGGERPRERHALLLTAGQHRGRPVGDGAQADLFQQRGGAGAAPGSADAPQPQREGDVLGGAQVREQTWLLEDEADAAPVRRSTVDLDAVDEHRADRRHGQAGDRAKQRRLPGAGRPEQDCELAVGDVQVDAGREPSGRRQPRRCRG